MVMMSVVMMVDSGDLNNSDGNDDGEDDYIQTSTIHHYYLFITIY
jgi:hypothetical protein